jgi:hypothetical protein
MTHSLHLLQMKGLYILELILATTEENAFIFLLFAIC